MPNATEAESVEARTPVPPDYSITFLNETGWTFVRTICSCNIAGASTQTESSVLITSESGATSTLGIDVPTHRNNYHDPRDGLGFMELGYSSIPVPGIWFEYRIVVALDGAGKTFFMARTPSRPLWFVPRSDGMDSLVIEKDGMGREYELFMRPHRGPGTVSASLGGVMRALN